MKKRLCAARAHGHWGGTTKERQRMRFGRGAQLNPTRRCSRKSMLRLSSTLTQANELVQNQSHEIGAWWVTHWHPETGFSSCSGRAVGLQRHADAPHRTSARRTLHALRSDARQVHPAAQVEAAQSTFLAHRR